MALRKPRKKEGIKVGGGGGKKEDDKLLSKISVSEKPSPAPPFRVHSPLAKESEKDLTQKKENRKVKSGQVNTDFTNVEIGLDSYKDSYQEFSSKYRIESFMNLLVYSYCTYLVHVV